MNAQLAGTAWSETENLATIEAYFQLFIADLMGKPINKSATYKDLSNEFGRSPKSYGRKMSNISAILVKLGWPSMDGLKPAFNYQGSLEILLAEHIAKKAPDDFVREANQAQVPPSLGSVDLIFKSPPELSNQNLKEHNNFSVISAKRNFVEIDAANHELGLRGEQVVVQHEKQRLHSLGYEKLSSRVEHVSQTIGDGLGYDILSFEPSGKERYIEVKTTNYNIYTPFFLTANEINFSKEARNSYRLYRIYNFTNIGVGKSKRAHSYALQGDLENAVDLTPISYKAFPSNAK